MAKLFAYSLANGMRIFPLPPGVHVLGRATDCQIPMPEERKLSSQHLRITVPPDGEPITVDDLGSRNGTTFDGQSFASHAVTSGDVFRVGKLALQIVVGDDDPCTLSRSDSSVAVPPPTQSQSSSSESAADVAPPTLTHSPGEQTLAITPDDLREDLGQAVPAELGGYQLVRRLGRGGVGIVYLGEHVSMGTLAAIKVITGEVSDAARGRFFREARAAFGLSHPNLVRVVHADQTPDGHPFLVMDFVDGPTLREYVPEGGLDESKVVELLLQMTVGYRLRIPPASSIATSSPTTSSSMRPPAPRESPTSGSPVNSTMTVTGSRATTRCLARRPTCRPSSGNEAPRSIIEPTSTRSG